MQVLKGSKVKFISAVVFLLTSFWIPLWFAHSSRSYCLCLKKKKKGPCWFYTYWTTFACVPRSFRQRWAGLCSVILFSCGSARMWAQSGLQQSQVPFSQPTPSEPSTAHCPLCAFAPGWPIIHHIFQTFGDSVRCTEREQIMPPYPLLAWPLGLWSPCLDA